MLIYIFLCSHGTHKMAGQDKIDTTVTLLLIVRSYSQCPKFFIVVVRRGVVDVKAVSYWSSNNIPCSIPISTTKTDNMILYMIPLEIWIHEVNFTLHWIHPNRYVMAKLTSWSPLYEAWLKLHDTTARYCCCRGVFVVLFSINSTSNCHCIIVAISFISIT